MNNYERTMYSKFLEVKKEENVSEKKVSSTLANWHSSIAVTNASDAQEYSEILSEMMIQFKLHTGIKIDD